MTTQTMEIPAPIKKAASDMLSTFVPGLTPDRLEAALHFPEANEREKLLTRKEAAKALTVSLPTIDRLMASGGLKRVKINGAVRIPESAIQKIITG